MTLGKENCEKNQYYFICYYLWFLPGIQICTIYLWIVYYWAIEWQKLDNRVAKVGQSIGKGLTIDWQKLDNRLAKNKTIEWQKFAN